MKKATVLAIAFTVLGILSIEAKAQSSNSPSTQQPPTAEQVQQATGRQQISKEELPDGIKEALKSDVLTVWQVSEVYKVASGGEATYEVYFINAEQKRAIARFDGEGNTVGLKNNISLTNTTHN